MSTLMTKHKSKFSTVLRVKTHQQKVAQVELRRCKEYHEQESRALDRLCERREEAFDASRGIQRTRLEELQAGRAFISRLSKQIVQQERRVVEANKEEERKTQELLQRMQAKKIVEKVKERQDGEILKELERKDQKAMDVIAQRRHQKELR
jgi:flagellar export protein FliJ